MSTEAWPAHNHGPSEGRGMDCGEKPIGWCIRLAKDAEIADLRGEVALLREEMSAEDAHADGKTCDACTHLQIADLLRQWEAANDEVARLTRLLEQRTAALTRTIDAKNTAEAEAGRLRDWKAEAAEVILGLQDVGRALGVGLGEQITGRSGLDAAKRLVDRAEAAEAKVARVEALHRPAKIDPKFKPYCQGCYDAGGEDGAPLWDDCPTRAALDGGQP